MKDRDFTTEFPRFSLADIRKGLGVSQAELANRMETTAERILEIENKGIDASVWEVLHMLNCLGCELEMHAELDGKKMDLKFPSGQEVDELT